MHTKIVAKAVIFNEKGEVLLLRRSNTDDRRPGEQDFPGGGIEPGEDLGAGVCREIFEEAGLQLTVDQVKLFYSHTEIMYDRENVTRLVFWSRISDPQITLSFEHDAYHWVAADKISTEFPHYVYGHSVDYGLQHRLFKS